MAVKDLYKYLKGTKKEVAVDDFKASIFNLCEDYLKSRTLTGEQQQTVARLRAYIEINFKAW